MRLTGGENYFEGRVEVCLEGQWNTVVLCDDSWSDPDAQVVCSQVGFFSPGECSDCMFSAIIYAVHLPLFGNAIKH